MKTHCRIYVVGDLPPDLKERIAALHAAVVLKSKDEAINVDTRGLGEGSGKAVESKT
jgi:hypothetical protein